MSYLVLLDVQEEFLNGFSNLVTGFKSTPTQNHSKKLTIRTIYIVKTNELL